MKFVGINIGKSIMNLWELQENKLLILNDIEKLFENGLKMV